VKLFTDSWGGIMRHLASVAVGFSFAALAPDPLATTTAPAPLRNTSVDREDFRSCADLLAYMIAVCDHQA
jgi:hypothetical protein